MKSYIALKFLSFHCNMSHLLFVFLLEAGRIYFILYFAYHSLYDDIIWYHASDEHIGVYATLNAEPCLRKWLSYWAYEIDRCFQPAMISRGKLHWTINDFAYLFSILAVSLLLIHFILYTMHFSDVIKYFVRSSTDRQSRSIGIPACSLRRRTAPFYGVDNADFISARTPASVECSVDDLLAVLLI